MKSKNVPEVEIVKLAGEWIWKVELNGVFIFSHSTDRKNAGMYRTPRGAKEAFGRWISGVDDITWRIYRYSNRLPNMDIRFKVEGE
jgi:hypothetical protein